MCFLYCAFATLETLLQCVMIKGKKEEVSGYGDGEVG